MLLIYTVLVVILCWTKQYILVPVLFLYTILPKQKDKRIVTKEASLLALHTEPTKWLSSVVGNIWPGLQRMISEKVKTILNDVLKSATPSFLSSLSMKVFSLGDNSPAILSVSHKNSDTLILDLLLHWMPSDTPGVDIQLGCLVV
jgi:Ca2+-dependent lipid-binding protein